MPRRCRLNCVLAVTVSIAIATSGPSAEKSAIQWKSDPAEAHRLARQWNRPMLLLITMDGCFYCTKMKQSTYRDAVLASDITNHFVAARVDSKQYATLARELGVQVYPTTVIISPDYKVVDVIRGYVNAKKLRRRLAVVTRRDRVTRLNDHTN